MKLKYGCNPHQEFARAEPASGRGAPVEILNGQPSLINVLDALNAWQLVREARSALRLPAAASFKHVSPAGAAVAVPLDDGLRKLYEVVDVELSPQATAYVRARGADPKSSFGDFVALSDPVDEATAQFLRGVVSDGIVAPDFAPAAFDVLKRKKQGRFIVMKADPSFSPPARETRELFGMKLEQDRNSRPFIDDDLRGVVCGELDQNARRDLLLGLITLKYTQSNSVGYAVGGQMVGIGAGQQSRIDCTKLAGRKADVWQLGRHPKVLGLSFRDGVKRQERINWRVRYIEGDLTPSEQTGFRDALAQEAPVLTDVERGVWLDDVSDVSMVSDGFIPFRDNIEQARKHGVRFLAQPGGSTRDGDVEAACREYGITLVNTGVRAFHH